MKRIVSLVLCFLLAFTLCQPVFAAGETVAGTEASDEDESRVSDSNSVQMDADSLMSSEKDGMPEENVCEIDGIGYPKLSDALAAIQNGESKAIRLLKNINYNSCIVVENKSITFNLNGFNLNVVNETEEGEFHEVSGLYVKGNVAVNLEGEGEFNVTGSWYGVFAECNEGETAAATVTNATGYKV